MDILTPITLIAGGYLFFNFLKNNVEVVDNAVEIQKLQRELAFLNKEKPVFRITAFKLKGRTFILISGKNKSQRIEIPANANSVYICFLTGYVNRTLPRFGHIHKFVYQPTCIYFSNQTQADCKKNKIYISPYKTSNPVTRFAQNKNTNCINFSINQLLHNRYLIIQNPNLEQGLTAKKYF